MPGVPLYEGLAYTFRWGVRSLATLDLWDRISAARVISPAGTVTNVFVVDSEPPRVFDRAALRAVARWKYRPKVEDGAAVVRHGVMVVLTFELVDD